MNILANDLEVTGKLLENGVDGLHDVTEDQRHALGARYQPKTGSIDRVYRYAKSGGVCRAGRGAAQWKTVAQGVDYKILSGAQKIGDYQVTFLTGATHPAFLKDELIGAPILISDSDAGGAVDADPQNRIIVGNDASLEDAALTVYLDTPLSRATAATTYAFLMPCPYIDIRYAPTSGGNAAIMGVPAAYVSAADRYFWIQTWGPCWVAMQSDLSTKNPVEMEAVWRWDGSVTLRSDSAAPGSHLEAQPAGYILDRGLSASFLMLQVAP